MIFDWREPIAGARLFDRYGEITLPIFYLNMRTGFAEFHVRKADGQFKLTDKGDEIETDYIQLQPPFVLIFSTAPYPTPEEIDELLELYIPRAIRSDIFTAYAMRQAPAFCRGAMSMRNYEIGIYGDPYTKHSTR